MNKTKLSFCDLSIEIESSDESTEDITNRALNGLAFLIQERLKYADFEPGEEDSGEVQDKTKPLQADIKFKQEGYQ